jgi:hypothetical protein
VLSASCGGGEGTVAQPEISLDKAFLDWLLSNLGVKIDRGKTVTKLFALTRLGLLLSEKQIPQVIEKPERGCESKELLEWAAVLRRQVLYPPELRAQATRLS